MSYCDICSDYIENGDFCRPLSQSYTKWLRSRKHYCDRVFIYGSLIFHSLNHIQKQLLHKSTCKKHAQERVRILNHFAFLADPANESSSNYFTAKSTRDTPISLPDIKYILKRNPKSQTFTLYNNSKFEERISEVYCEVIPNESYITEANLSPPTIW